MSQFKTIFKYEYLGIIRKKSFKVMTILVAVILAIAMSVPSIIALVKNIRGSNTPEESVTPPTENVISDGDSVDAKEEADNRKAIAAFDKSGAYDGLNEGLSLVFPQYKVVSTDETEEELKSDIDNGTYEFAVLIEDVLHFKYITQSMSMTNTEAAKISAFLENTYKVNYLIENGISPEEASEFVNSTVTYDAIETGKSFIGAYIFTYFIMFVLYMVILLYGQMVTTSVITEKSSRAMELLVTTAKPSNLMFGKVIGTGAAGLTQLAIWIAVAVIFYNVNSFSYGQNPIISSIFSIDPKIVVYAVIFFILGYFMYSFMFGALGSLSSRMEDVNTTIIPIMLIYVVTLYICIFAMSTDMVDSLLMKVTSFIPFCTPMIMFVRISMGEVPIWQVLISIVVLILSTGLIGYVAAKIYRVGILMYGKPPKLKELIKVLKNSK